MDGADFVLCEIQKKPLKIKYLDHSHVNFSPKLRKKLQRCAQNKALTYELAETNYELGLFYANSLKKIKNRKKWKFNLVGLHGQTVFHKGGKSTLQIGESSFLSEVMTVPVVSDFRAADIALGGQGAPLATFFHQVAFSHLGYPFAVHNLGGISNMSFFDRKKSFSFDTGPANMPMDLRLQEITRKKLSFDKDGAIAAQGIIHMDLVEKWLKHPYFRQKPPKSCGREEFGEVFLDKVRSSLTKLNKKDQMATLTEFVAQSITKSYKSLLPKLPKTIVLCGGGAKNNELVFRLRYHLPNIQVLKCMDLGWPAESIEGAAFALMAACRLWKIPAHLPKTTGANKPALLGKLSQVQI